MNNEWVLAAGSCGFNIGEKPVYAKYVNGVPLFAFESGLSRPDKPFWQCVVTGHMTAGGATLEEAQANGEEFARRNGANRRYTKAEFLAVVADPKRLD